MLCSGEKGTFDFVLNWPSLVSEIAPQLSSCQTTQITRAAHPETQKQPRQQKGL